MVAGLALMSAAFAGIIVLERQGTTGDAGRAMPVAAAPAASSGGGRVPAGDAIPAAVAVVLARPLFEPDRRPIAGPAASARVAEGLPRLTGVLVTPAGRSVIFAASSGGRPVVATEGSRIGAFVVQSIGAGEVTILGPDGVHTIRPSFDPDRKATPPEAPVPRQPAADIVPAPVMPPHFDPATNPNTITLPLQSPS